MIYIVLMFSEVYISEICMVQISKENLIFIMKHCLNFHRSSRFKEQRKSKQAPGVTYPSSADTNLCQSPYRGGLVSATFDEHFKSSWAGCGTSSHVRKSQASDELPSWPVCGNVWSLLILQSPGCFPLGKKMKVLICFVNLSAIGWYVYAFPLWRGLFTET
jgi:hypothetical protein